uniref:SFRICE_038828 n=1 Tax=Spodoptera frugiperda TaxID=7108 RepID=A0A2H1W559_SPOFR
MFRLPYGERVDPMEEKRQARENTISSVITFAILCAAIRVVTLCFDLLPLFWNTADFNHRKIYTTWRKSNTTLRKHAS